MAKAKNRYSVEGSVVTINPVKTRLTADHDQEESVLHLDFGFDLSKLPLWAVERIAGKTVIDVQGKWRSRENIPAEETWTIDANGGLNKPMTKEEARATAEAALRQLQEMGMSPEEIAKLINK